MCLDRKRHGETDISPPSGRRSYETHGGAEEEQYNRHYDYTRRETTRSEREPHDHRSRQEDWDQWAREKMVSKEGVQQRGAYDDRRRDDYAWKGREDEQRVSDLVVIINYYEWQTRYKIAIIDQGEILN